MYLTMRNVCMKNAIYFGKERVRFPFFITRIRSTILNGRRTITSITNERRAIRRVSATFGTL